MSKISGPEVSLFLTGRGGGDWTWVRNIRVMRQVKEGEQSQTDRGQNIINHLMFEINNT